MKRDYEKITELIESINKNNQATYQLKEEQDSKLKEKLALKDAQLMMQLEEINNNYRRRIKLFNQLCQEYKYADLRESKEILERMKNLFN